MADKLDLRKEGVKSDVTEKTAMNTTAGETKR